MSSTERLPTARLRLGPWLAAILTVYLLTVAAWFVAIDWSTAGDGAWAGRVAALPASTRSGP